MKKEKHYTATIFIISKEHPKRTILIHHKKIDKWLPPGGHQDTFENAWETAIREASEETGLDISKILKAPEKIDNRAVFLPLPRFILEEKIDSHGTKPAHFHLDITYVVEIPMKKIINNKDESHKIGWFSLKEIQKLETFDNVKTLLKSLL